jgi:chromosome segregation ATPase
MELFEYIRSKSLLSDLMFELFDIARRENVVEGLIDYIAEKFPELYGAEDKIGELECNVEQLEERVTELEQELKESKEKIEEYEADTIESYDSFKIFVEKFKEENNRHPSIDETWEAVWESSK